MLGRRYTGGEQDNFITMCQKGGLDACVLSVTSAKNGTNLQGMSVGICLNVLTAEGVVEQCKGILFHHSADFRALQLVRTNQGYNVA